MTRGAVSQGAASTAATRSAPVQEHSSVMRAFVKRRAFVSEIWTAWVSVFVRRGSVAIPALMILNVQQDSAVKRGAAWSLRAVFETRPVWGPAFAPWGAALSLSVRSMRIALKLRIVWIVSVEPLWRLAARRSVEMS